MSLAVAALSHAPSFGNVDPGGALATPQLAEAYRRTLRTIQIHELEALAAGDGFTESPSEDAAIDAVADLELDALQPRDDTRRVAEDALREETNDLAIALNDSVLACIDLYQGELRQWFGDALARGGRYLPRIREVFAAQGIPQDLAYVALVESAEPHFKGTDEELNAIVDWLMTLKAS